MQKSFFLFQSVQNRDMYNHPVLCVRILRQYLKELKQLIFSFEMSIHKVHLWENFGYSIDPKNYFMGNFSKMLNSYNLS